MDALIRSAALGDAADIAPIYNHYVVNTCITFETTAVSPSEMERRIAETSSANLPWLVAQASHGVVGYAYASSWKGRCAYRFSVESTIYVDPGHLHRGLGKRLYGALVDEIRKLSMHAVIGGIALPNEPSIRLHERLGFKKVAHFEQVGYKQDRWIDVGYWQRLL